MATELHLQQTRYYGPFAPVEFVGRNALTGMFHTDAYDVSTAATAAANTTALQAALTAGPGGVVFLPGDFTLNANTLGLTIPASTTLRGQSGVPTSLRFFNAAGDSSYGTLFQNAGDGVVFENVKMERAADLSTVIIDVRAYNGLTFTNCIFDGRNNLYATSANVFRVGGYPGTTSNVRLTGCKVTRANFGLYMDNTATATVTGLCVDGCTFTANQATDLELNSPSGTFTDIVVSNTHFGGNLSVTAAAGWAVGLANVRGVKLTGNTYTGYNNEAIHLEDGASDVDIVGETFTSCALTRAAYIYGFAVNNIRIRRSKIDGRANTNTNAALVNFFQNFAGHVLTSTSSATVGTGKTVSVTGSNTIVPSGTVVTFSGGGVLTTTAAAVVHATQLVGNVTVAAVAAAETATLFLTVGGRSITTISANITLESCDLFAGGYLDAVSGAKVNDYTISNNVILGAGGVFTGTYVNGGRNCSGISLSGGLRPKVSHNKLTGFYSTFPRLDANYFGGDGGSLIGNQIENCNFGIIGLNAAAMSFLVNVITNCVFPFFVGQGVTTRSAKSVTVTGNVAIGCTNPMQIEGTISVVSSSARTSGTTGAVTLAASFTGSMPVGTVVTFSGGGVLTLTAAATNTNSLTGTVTVANIASGETASPAVPFSTGAYSLTKYGNVNAGV